MGGGEQNMTGAIQAIFINAEEQEYNIDNKPLTVFYITIIDEDSRGVQDRYTQLKIREEDYKRLGLNTLIKVKEYQGKLCLFNGKWTKQNKTVRVGAGSTNSSQWNFHVLSLKVVEPEKKTT
jgi:hypothetical protein